MKFWTSIAILLSLLPAISAQTDGTEAIKPEVTTIWNNDDHSAFTSLLKFKGRYYCAFREYDSHIFNEEGKALGKIRILSSRNGKKWKSAAYFGKDSCDLRDPKLSIAPDGRMMVIIGGSYYVEKQLKRQIPQVCFSSDGKSFTPPESCIVRTDFSDGRNWIWRVTWNGDAGYSVCYTTAEGKQESFLSLLSTNDGITYNLVNMFDIDGSPNEATVRFLEDGRMVIAIRRDGEKDSGMVWAVAEAPYTDWKQTEMDFRIGGPDILVIDENHIILSGRSYSASGAKTSIWLGNADGEFKKEVDLPSSGDCSYPGLLLKGKNLWISYYTASEQATSGNKTEIRLARIPIKELIEE